MSCIHIVNIHINKLYLIAIICVGVTVSKSHNRVSSSVANATVSW